ncbi:MAG: ribosome small subunit-dependent GTPase A [Planctomycetes bacterium]|nr:ribosome small subunit-dependent GTPase A [Planctomycetota bacterium]
MDYEEKRKQTERALKGMKKAKTLAERKEMARQTKSRKSMQKQRARPRRDWSDYDEEDPFEDFERITSLAETPTFARKSDSDAQTNHDWLVVAVHANRIEIHKKEKRRDAHLGGRRLAEGPPVVGDRIAVEELPGGECRLRSIGPRESLLSRRDPGNPHKSKLLAANVDLALIAVTPQEDGHLRLGIVERLRIALQSGQIEPVVVVTKADRHVGPARERLLADLEELTDSGLECFLTSSLSGEGVPELAERVAGLTTVITGHSGVGKSTLLNALDPEHERDTGGVRESDDRGRHTTTSSCMLPMPGGCWLVDTPGIRQFGLSDVTRDELLAWYPRLVDLAHDCPRACDHLQDDCALVEASGSDDRVRHDLVSYRRILGELAD